MLRRYERKLNRQFSVRLTYVGIDAVILDEMVLISDGISNCAFDTWVIEGTNISILD